MTVIVNNHSGTNVILSVNQSNYLIKENDCDLVLTVENETTSFSLKREKSISAPPYKKMLLFEILGIVSLLFSKPSYYMLDVSSTYYLKTNEECVTIDIIRKECSSGNIGIYDVIVAESIDSKLTATGYCVENSNEILAVFNKSTKVGDFWRCVIAVLSFAFMASLVICPLLLAMYFATKSDLFISLMIIVPISSIVFLGLILGLPLHFMQKSQHKNFYRTMESAEIFFRLNEQEEQKQL